MMKPSPPKNPVPSLRWNAMPSDTPLAAQRNASRWQIRVPPMLDRSKGMILPV